MQPAVGVPLESRQDWHRNLEAAIQHHSTTLAKQPAISVVEPNGKVQVQVNYSECLYSGWSEGCGGDMEGGVVEFNDNDCQCIRGCGLKYGEGL